MWVDLGTAGSNDTLHLGIACVYIEQLKHSNDVCVETLIGILVLLTSAAAFSFILM